MNDSDKDFIPKPQFFYTTEYPHRWTSGETIHIFNGNRLIESLEEAKLLAEKHYVGGSSESTCRTTYGVMYNVVKDWRDEQ